MMKKKAFSISEKIQRKAIGLSSDDDEGLIAEIMPLAPPKFPVREQILMRMSIGLPITERQLGELKALNEQDKISAAQKWQLEKSLHRRALGLESQPLFEDGADGATKRAALWERHRLGALTLEECVAQCVVIRLAKEAAPTRRLLTEQKQDCHDGCDCESCHLQSFRDLLETRVAAGTMTRQQADSCYDHRCAL